MQIYEIIEALEHNIVPNLDVVVHQDIAETDRPSHIVRQLRRQNAVTPEQTHGVTIICRRSPALRRTKVLSDIQACLDRRHKGVLHATQPHRIVTPMWSGAAFGVQH